MVDNGQSDRTSSKWIALSPDGVRHHFEHVVGAPVRGVWNITRQVDPFGNAVTYSWAPIFRGDRYLGESLLAIEYSENEGASLLPYAKVEFDYALLEYCEESDIPIGAAYRRGNKQVTGAQKLNAIRVLVRDTQTSDWSLRKAGRSELQNRKLCTL
ncbi:hypothetical protein [Rhodohalobacter sp.]|uniref:hypothetical protein n=1 Tax=Rhodohalobacter sp. TaxID=1974210 RepID=UPI002ACE8DDD|nr:hypothetical protein [Rhodohalobacter sp.]MDZ7757530.1 hypothetical protein [Rhodohalobacter sp.]